MTIDTAVILARGLGTRMRAAQAVALSPAQATAAAAGAKALMPIADATGRDRPFLDWALSGLADAGFTRAVLVVPPDHAAWRAWYEGAGRPRRVAVAYAVQPEPTGTADAVVCAAQVAPPPFVVVNGDNLYPRAALEALRHAAGAAGIAFDAAALVREGNIPADRLGAFARVEVAPDGTLAALVEKPGGTGIPPWPVSMNCWTITAPIVAHCRTVAPSVRGERELPEAIARAVQDGVAVAMPQVAAGVLDLSGRSDIAALGPRLRALAVDP
jgi:glucose-1-phosphate thymidylyltransferase